MLSGSIKLLTWDEKWAMVSLLLKVRFKGLFFERRLFIISLFDIPFFKIYLPGLGLNFLSSAAFLKKFRLSTRKMIESYAEFFVSKDGIKISLEGVLKDVFEVKKILLKTPIITSSDIIIINKKNLIKLGFTSYRLIIPE